MIYVIGGGICGGISEEPLTPVAAPAHALGHQPHDDALKVLARWVVVARARQASVVERATGGEAVALGVRQRGRRVGRSVGHKTIN